MAHKVSLAAVLVVLLSREIFARTTGKILAWNDVGDFDREFSVNIGGIKQERLSAYSHYPDDPAGTLKVYQAQQSGDDDEGPDHVSPDHASSPESGDVDSQLVGVKAHSNHGNHKKSNAVGDPDGEGSDSDDDDSDFDESDWESIHFAQDQQNEIELDSPPPQVQVQLELMQDAELGDEPNSNRQLSSRRTGGGVGLRFGQKFQNNRRKNRTAHHEVEQSMVDAWKRYVFSPPASLTSLKERARKLDGDSKLRLDRRTLYSCLLLEWRGLWTSERKFLQPSTSQALQAALSLATQPSWRKSLSQASAVRLYDSQDADQGPTLAMQETVALALVSQLV